MEYMVWDFPIWFGWGLMLLGGLSGAVIGLYFHDPEWAGGYSSFRRRMLRLGHIAFFGMGMINVLAGLTGRMLLPGENAPLVISGLLLAGVGMPLLCLLSAWRERFRHLFFIPVLALMLGILPLIFGGMV